MIATCASLLAGCKDGPTGPKTGKLTLTIVGVPAGASALVTVSGPRFTRTVGITETLVDLPPGNYTLTSEPVTVAGARYSPTLPTQTVTITASDTPVAASVTYAISTGSITLTIRGLPGQAPGAVTVSGPAGYQRAFTATETIRGLEPGEYTVAATNVNTGGDIFAPLLESQRLAVAASETAIEAVVAYSLASGTLTVTINGLPQGASSGVTIVEPNGTSRVTGSSQTYVGVIAGLYRVNATVTRVGTINYIPATSGVNVTVVPGQETVARIDFSPEGVINLTIDGLYITQVVQSYNGAVPLVSNRDGFLRVFAKANQSNGAAAQVRVRFYHGATLVDTRTLTAPTTSVPNAIDEGALNLSWNTFVSAALIRPGLRILADVDPTNQIGESSETDNQFPASGTPLALTVHRISPLRLRFVPVTQTVNSRTGNVTDANKAQFYARALQLLPIETIDADVRAPFTTSTPVLQANDGNNAWTTILSEVNALRTADASDRYYFGVVGVTYSSGVAGYGYVPGRAAIGWDYLPSGASIAAHELGHNLGRFHAPCGGAAGADPNYPYAAGGIGVYGYDIATSQLRDPLAKDFMGYCGFTWISDYNYSAILTHLLNTQIPPTGNVLASQTGGTRPSLLVWGRVDKGRLVLEPAFTVETRATLPSRPGRLRLEALDAAGNTLFAYSFEGEIPDHSAGGDDRHFAFAIPLDASFESSLVAIRLSDGRRSVTRRAAPSGMSTATVAADVRGAGRTRLRWNAATLPMALIRNGRTGEILGFARGGDAEIASGADDLDVILSDGVRSVRRAVRAR